jgi:hypothetical protein
MDCLGEGAVFEHRIGNFLINQLAAKVIEALKVNPTIKEWSDADEAAQYYDEAKWALRWGVLKEAQAAADSAWALGKHDQNCATIRIKSYETPIHCGYRNGESTNPNSTNEVIQMAVQEALPNHAWGLTLTVTWEPASICSDPAKVTSLSPKKSPP